MQSLGQVCGVGQDAVWYEVVQQMAQAVIEAGKEGRVSGYIGRGEGRGCL